ncbi:hypothetical protein R1sor_013719 [Riccia sorocarpa]|uniref:Reverse transcriptase domain-containing protein n=1 Tax=Riccia sorocarpa TaxID=122646 RepID=A0ABD3HB06_9MARC
MVVKVWRSSRLLSKDNRGGAAQVHVNGRFTQRFEVTHGVRQGCPLASLLFVMVTQPLMRLLHEEELSGRLLGVTYGGQKTLLHQIYADDTGVNLTIQEAHFNKLKEVIQTFEEISGAKSNLTKSLIMPIRPSSPPGWVYATGCDIAGPRKSFLYLGRTTCNPVDEATIAKAITKKMMKKLSHWSKPHTYTPIRPSSPPGWVYATGCDIAGPRKSFLYLGRTTCNSVNEATIAKAITKKMMKKLSHWSKPHTYTTLPS